MSTGQRSGRCRAGGEHNETACCRRCVTAACFAWRSSVGSVGRVSTAC
jgi:hypothetical protein